MNKFHLPSQNKNRVMTDADGFRGHSYRPHGLPQDVVDPSPEEDDISKQPHVGTSYGHVYAETDTDVEEDAETASQTSRSSSSSYTYVNSQRVPSPPPPPAALAAGGYEYIFPARRAPESMSDRSYGQRSSMDYTPRTSEYAPSYTTEWTPPESADEHEQESVDTRPPSTYVPPTEIEDISAQTPLVPRARWRCFGARSSRTLPAHSGKRRRSGCVRTTALFVLLFPLLFWVYGRSIMKHTFAEIEVTSPYGLRK